MGAEISRTYWKTLAVPYEMEKNLSEAFVGCQVVSIDTGLEAGGIRFHLLSEGRPRSVTLTPGSQGGIYISEWKEGGSSGTWKDFSLLLTNISLHVCPEPSIVPTDDPRLRQVGFSCKGCDTDWGISLTNLFRSTHPWVNAMTTVEHRLFVAKHLASMGTGHEEVPREWTLFLRGQGPFPG